MLGEDVPPPPIPPFWPNPSQQQNGGGRNGASGKLVPIPRSASYYSLPEFVIRDEDEEEILKNGLNEMEDEDDEQNQQPSTSTASSTFPPPLPRQTMPTATLGSSAALLETSTASTANNYSSITTPLTRSVRFAN